MALAAVQSGDTGVSLVNSGSAGTILPGNTTIANTVVLAIVSAGGVAGDVLSVSSSIGTFTRVVAAGVTGHAFSTEYWTGTATAAHATVTVTTTSGAQWAAQAVEVSGSIGSVTNPTSVTGTSATTYSLPFSGLAAGQMVFGFLNTLGNYNNSAPASPFTDYNAGAFTAANGLGVAYQVVAATSVTATWVGAALAAFAIVGVILTPSSTAGAAGGSTSVTGSAAGAIGLSVPASGSIGVSGVAAGAVGLAATATGSIGVSGVAAAGPVFSSHATGSISVVGVAVGVAGERPTAAGSISVTGVAVGGINVPPMAPTFTNGLAIFVTPQVRDRPPYLPNSTPRQVGLMRHFENRLRGVLVWLRNDGTYCVDTICNYEAAMTEPAAGITDDVVGPDLDRGLLQGLTDSNVSYPWNPFPGSTNSTTAGSYAYNVNWDQTTQDFILNPNLIQWWEGGAENVITQSQLWPSLAAGFGGLLSRTARADASIGSQPQGLGPYGSSAINSAP